MPLEAPNLDDRRFADLVKEARSRIPRYAPEWTDHNLSDPGITLIQLFAWLGEIIIFRLNQVPEKNFINFLRLIGVERKPAAPAAAEVTFKLASPDTVSVIIPKGTQLRAQAVEPPPSAVSSPLPPPEEDEGPVVFETEEPLNALGAVLSKVQVFDGINFQDFTEANNPSGESYLPFGSKTRDGSALMLGFASNSAFPTVEVSLTVRAFTDPDTLGPASCDLPEELITPSAGVVWEFWDGGAWRRLDVVKDETRALTASGRVYFRGPKEIRKAKLGALTAAEDEELFWIRCRLVRSQYEMPPALDAVLTNTVRARAVTSVKDEAIGSSNGEPTQVFALRNTPVYAAAPRPVDERLSAESARTQPPTEAEQEVLDRALREREFAKGFWLEVDEGRGFKPWEEVEDFFNSGPDSRHYVLNRTTGEITFGDGERGAIPVAGINNVVVRLYRYGGGARGNVGAGTITDLQTPVAGVDEVTNHYAAEGGADEEAIEDTKARAPQELKAQNRAVTKEDFQFLALQTPGVRVRRAHAVPLYHPQIEGVQVPGVITVFVIPESLDPKPVPSEGTLRTVCAYLNQRRLLTTEVFVAPPRYKQVKIEATVVVRPTADAARAKAAIEQALTTYLHPLTGGKDRLGWPFGGDVFASEIFRVVLQNEDVQLIEDLRIVVEGERFGRCEDAAIPDDHLVFSDGHEINVAFAPLNS